MVLRQSDGGLVEILAALIDSVPPYVTYGAGALMTSTEAQVPRIASELRLE